MRVLVTGGAGYIGSTTAQALNDAGHEVLVADNLSHGHREAVPERAHFEQLDLAVVTDIRNAFHRFKPEAVMHFAGHIQVSESMKDPLKYLGGNVASATNLLQAVLDFGVPRFVFSSTANLFSKSQAGLIDESSPISPGSPYGESKLYVERILGWLEKTHGIRYACLRYFNAAGAGPSYGENHHPETHLIPLILEVALGRRERITIYGDDYGTPDGTCIRDFIHVEDLAQAHLLSLDALETGSRTYNIGNGTGFSVMQVLSVAREITKHPIPTEVAPRRPGDVAMLVADSSRIRAELGWRPRKPDLRTIVEDAWRWSKRLYNVP